MTETRPAPPDPAALADAVVARVLARAGDGARRRRHAAAPTTTATSSTARTAPRCGGSPACPPSSPTSPRSSTGSLRLERVVLVGVWTARRRDGGRGLAARARGARRDRRARRCSTACCSAGQHPDPGTYLGLGQGRRARRARRGHRRRHRHRRRRPRPVAAPCAGGRRQGQGDRPDRADPRHLRPARQVQGGQGAGRARPARVPAAAPARLGRVDVPAGRWPGRRRRGDRLARPRRDEDRARPPPDPHPDGQAAPRDRRDGPGPRDPAGLAAAAPRARRSRSSGYTNAGKSSLLNRLTGAGVLVENALFATLDPTVRRTQTPDGRTYTLSDTVGFVRALPHPAGRGVPLDPGGGRRGRRAAARRGRLPPRPGGPGRSGARRARRDRRRSTRSASSSCSTRPTSPIRRRSPGCCAANRARRRLGAHGRRARRAARRASPSHCPAPRRRSTSWCPTRVGTWSAGRTPRAR